MRSVEQIPTDKTALVGYYLNAGIRLVRLKAADRLPLDPDWQKPEIVDHQQEVFEDHVRRGGGLAWQLGEVSNGLAVVDNDWDLAGKLAPKFLPETLRGAKGNEPPSHYAYNSPGLGYGQFNGLDNSRIIDVKASNNGRGHFVAVAPTVHPKKGPYHFVGGYNPASIEYLEPEDLKRKIQLLAAASLIAAHLPGSREEGVGGRHDLALALIGYLLRNGEPVEDVERVLVAAWEVRGAPREAIEDLRRSIPDTADRLSRDEPVKGGHKLEEAVTGMPRRIAEFLDWPSRDMEEKRKSYTHSDLGNAERFVDMHADRVRWCPARKLWLFWDGKRWTWDDRGEVTKLAHETARSIFADAEHATDQQTQRQIAKFAVASQNQNRISGMLSAAQPYLAVGMEELDRDPWLMTCENGTLDLRIGELRDHDPQDHITKLAPVPYQPDAKAPVFKQYLRDTLEDAVVTFLKRYSGYTLTGITRERLFAILWGSGKNGKTTLVELLEDVMGDYATNTDTETILAKKYQGVGNDVAALRGARFVSAAEVEQGRRLAESKVKQLTGSDTVTARHLFGEPFDFRPQFKLWLSTNNKPVIQGTDDAIWDRIRLIPFTQRFEGARQDPNLAEKLRGELPGVFAWMVSGCLEWQEHGLGAPESVRGATEEYRAEMDTLAAFIDEKCVVAPNATVSAENLYQQYSLWCDNYGERKDSQKALAPKLRDRGFERKRASSGVNRGRYVWVGIGLRNDGETPDDDDEGSRGGGGCGKGSHPESGIDTPKNSSSTSEREPCEAENQKVSKQNAREDKLLDKGSQGSQGSHNPPNTHNTTTPATPYVLQAERPSVPNSYLTRPEDGAVDVERTKVRGEVHSLFQHPPAWLPPQVGVYVKRPEERLVKALSNSVAYVLGYPPGGVPDDVRLQVERELEAECSDQTDQDKRADARRTA